MGQRSVNQTILIKLDSYIDAILITDSHLVSSSSSQLVSKSVADVIVTSHSYGHMVIWSVCQSVSHKVRSAVSQNASQSVTINQSHRLIQLIRQPANHSESQSVSSYSVASLPASWSSKSVSLPTQPSVSKSLSQSFTHPVCQQ